jgi:hypothetical protein
MDFWTGIIVCLDAWMQKTVSRCQLLVFLSTENSLDSNDCASELVIANENGLQIIPILGIGLSWDDLRKLEIHREFGAEFKPMEFEKFFIKLYLEIEKFTHISTTDRKVKGKNFKIIVKWF